MRINKYLAEQKMATRRGADELIKQGLVKLNGRLAQLGDEVNEGDEVVLHKKVMEKTYTYLAYHKPIGIATHSSDDSEVDIRKSLALPRDMFPIGRLDKNSSGLIILTNDGRITDALLNPDKNHEKEYVVTINKTVDPEAIKKLSSGIRIENYKTKPAVATKTGDKEITIILTEGKKHQVRRMVVACGYEVIRLVRTRIMNIELGDLETGRYRKLEGDELSVFLKQLSL